MAIRVGCLTVNAYGALLQGEYNTIQDAFYCSPSMTLRNCLYDVLLGNI